MQGLCIDTIQNQSQEFEKNQCVSKNWIHCYSYHIQVIHTYKTYNQVKHDVN